MGRTIVCGDLHGGNKALVQCLERSSFDKEEDTLIQLGDVVDGWSEVYETVETLLSIRKTICLKGNHDEWLNQFIERGVHPVDWLHGGHSTLSSYSKYAGRDVVIHPKLGAWISTLTSVDIPNNHRDFFAKQRLYHVDYKNRCYVHGGFDRMDFLDIQAVGTPYNLYWDRELWYKAMSCVGDQRLMTVDNFSEVYIGHTATINWKDVNGPITFPMSRGGVTNMDTGGGFGGCLSFMDVDTKEVWQSDMMNELYSDEKGRV